MTYATTPRRMAFAALGMLVPLSALALAAMPPGASRSSSLPVERADATRLIDAVMRDDLHALQSLAGQGANLDASVPGDGTALIVASRRGDLAMVNTLLTLGANVNTAVQGDGSALIAAASTGNIDIMTRLLAAGARVDAITPDDETALISAVRSDHQNAVRLLVEHGADVNLGVFANGSQWRSPLNQARSDQVRQYLLGRGAVAGSPPRAGG